ncbi:MAG: helix-turn-helix domain-containing protein [Patescibacteria group bacterium]|nr:helix-turn-helix domain-containing protein [Patescibacteria group bacterium]
MFNFQESIKQNNILGKKLSDKRISQNIRIEDAEEAINIQKKYLLAIEEGNYNILPGQIYTKNFVKTYADFLGLDVDACLENLEREYFLFNHITNSQHIKKQRSSIKFKNFFCYSNLRFVITPKILKNIAVVAAFLLCFTYLGAEAKNIFNPPQIEIFYPLNNLVVEKQIIEIKGITEKGADISINDRNILTDVDGNFAKNICLRSGVNIIKITANKKYSKTNIIFRKVLVVK